MSTTIRFWAFPDTGPRMIFYSIRATNFLNVTKKVLLWLFTVLQIEPLTLKLVILLDSFPLKMALPTGAVELFADGFARADTIKSVRDAVYRPMGLAEGPDGSLYIGETEKGAIWRVAYTEDKKKFGTINLMSMQLRQNLPHFKTPDPEKDNLQINRSPQAAVYNQYCSACHQSNGLGDGARFPPLAGTDWVNGDKSRLIEVVLLGLDGEIEVNGRSYNNVMPKHDFLSDKEVSEVLTFIRQNFDNNSSPVSESEVQEVRAALQPQL